MRIDVMRIGMPSSFDVMRLAEQTYRNGLTGVGYSMACGNGTVIFHYGEGFEREAFGLVDFLKNHGFETEVR